MTAYDDAVLADSPAVYLKMDEASGTTAADSSGNSRPANVGTTTILGEAAIMPSGTSSFGIDATTASLVVPGAAWQAATSFTVEAWVVLDATGSFHAIASRDDDGPRQWSFYVVDGKLTAYSNIKVLEGPANIVAGTVYHVAMTYSLTTGVVSLYRNGALVTSGASGGINNGSTTIRLRIGASPAGNNEIFAYFPLDGNMSHFAYYTSELSAARIAAHYAAATASPGITVTPPTATATATAHAPTVTATSDVTVAAPAATATAQAHAPVVAITGNVTVAAPVATATAQAHAPTVTTERNATVTAPAATGTATAYAPTVTIAGNVVIVAPPATSTAQAYAPAAVGEFASVTIEPPTATAFAWADAPTLDYDPPLATPPATYTPAVRVEKAIAYPAPTLVNGRAT